MIRLPFSNYQNPLTPFNVLSFRALPAMHEISPKDPGHAGHLSSPFVIKDATRKMECEIWAFLTNKFCFARTAKSSEATHFPYITESVSTER